MYYDLITKPFINGIKEQNIDENKLVEGLNSSFNYSFSTFPYIFHKMKVVCLNFYHEQ